MEVKSDEATMLFLDRKHHTRDEFDNTPLPKRMQALGFLLNNLKPSTQVKTTMETYSSW